MKEMHKDIPMIDTSESCRPKDLLIKFSKKYSGLWQEMDFDRTSWEQKYPVPKWSFTTQVASANAFKKYITSISPDVFINESSPGFMMNALTSHFLYSWRATQGVYRVDQELFKVLVDTESCGSIPSDVLDKIPEWCIYVESPNLKFMPASSSVEVNEAFGFFALLDPDRETGEPWLSIFIDGKQAYELATIKLIPGKSIEECVKGTVEIIRKRNPNHPINSNQEKNLSALITPFLNILLFICTQASELGDGVVKPVLPQPKKTKRGNRFFPPNEPKVWDVGVRIGSALKIARESEGKESESGGGTVRPHIRRAHWHGYWYGQRDTDRYFKLKWIPPIPVKVEDYDNIPAVIRGVAD